MTQEEHSRVREALETFFNESLERVLLSNPRCPQECLKAKIRPVMGGKGLFFQAEEQVAKQAFHKNLAKDEAVQYVLTALETNFRQAEITSALGSGLILVSKKGKVTVKEKRVKNASPSRIVPLSHNRQKRYILQEGIPVPFLIDLGVMTEDGRVIKSRYDKFRQINRFLEMVEDILPGLDKNRENTIIDFGCGKSYLTFAMYYYLKVLKGYEVRIIGLDLKKDVIEHCEELARAYGYDRLHFTWGDIATYEGVTSVDMVVTLHACDKATDYALAKAVEWGAKVILSVPCCQHELNAQIQNELLAPILNYGIIKERTAALYTDAIRAQALECVGYRTQILEFIDMEHTPKNILIRAVYQGGSKDNKEEIRELANFLHVRPTILDLLLPGWEEA